MSHQDSICKIIHSTLNLGKETVEAFRRGNPFDKLLRSYDEFTAEGLPLYRNDRGKNHYKYSEKAYNSGLSAKDLYGEHRMPLKVIRERLLQCSGSLNGIEKIMRSNEVVLITKEEQKMLDSRPPEGFGLRSKLPACGTDRLAYAGIKIVEETLHNRL
jgi:hypothetical protein